MQHRAPHTLASFFSVYINIQQSRQNFTVSGIHVCGVQHAILHYSSVLVVSHSFESASEWLDHTQSGLRMLHEEQDKRTVNIDNPSIHSFAGAEKVETLSSTLHPVQHISPDVW